MNFPVLHTPLSRYLAPALLSLATLAGCADPSARAVVLTSSHASETVKDIDVILVPPGDIHFPLIAQSMDRARWSRGQFESGFCDRLAKNFLARGVRIHKVQSFWGPQREMRYASTDAGHEPEYQMIVAPINVRAMLPARAGRVIGSTDSFAILSRVIIRKRNVVVWEAKAEANLAPIDPTGAERFTIGILNSMADSGLINPKP